jgi:hypothetical protein
MLASSSKRRSLPCRATPSTTCSSVFYWSRPLGAQQGTFRLTIEPDNHQRSYWALARPFHELIQVLQEDSVENLELTGENKEAWNELAHADWRLVCSLLDKVVSVHFLCECGMNEKQQAQLVQHLPRLRHIEMAYPKALSLDCERLESLKIRQSRLELSLADAHTLSSFLQKSQLHSFALEAEMSYEAWRVIFESLEASMTLETIHCTHELFSLEIKCYLDDKARLNQMRRVWMEQNKFHIDSVVTILHEWWRSTHRPQLVPPNDITKCEV